jgi:hypothetical protein
MKEASKIVIAVLDHGFVYVGNAKISKDWCVIRNAKNIRRWGTERGLGQLALEGPTSKTKLDDVGTVRIPLTALVHLIDAEASKWN